MIKLRNRDYQNGITFIELMLILAIFGLLVVILITNFMKYQDKAYCHKVEEDAQKIIAALSAYFADPEHKSIPTIDELQNSMDLQLNNHKEISYSSTGSKWAIISLGDDSGRCPYDRKNLKYHAYFGIDGTSGWK